MKKFLFSIAALVCFSLSSFANDNVTKIIELPAPAENIAVSTNDDCDLYKVSYAYAELAECGSWDNPDDVTLHFGSFYILIC